MAFVRSSRSSIHRPWRRFLSMASSRTRRSAKSSASNRERSEGWRADLSACLQSPQSSRPQRSVISRAMWVRVASFSRMRAACMIFLSAVFQRTEISFRLSPSHSSSRIPSSACHASRAPWIACQNASGRRGRTQDDPSRDTTKPLAYATSLWISP